MVTLLSACHPRLYPLVTCALMTGMRKGEILALNWENVDLGTGIIYVIESKSGKPREIPITSKLDEVFGSLNPRSRGSVFSIGETMQRRFFAQAIMENFSSGMDTIWTPRGVSSSGDQEEIRLNPLENQPMWPHRLAA